MSDMEGVNEVCFWYLEDQGPEKKIVWDIGLSSPVRFDEAVHLIDVMDVRVDDPWQKTSDSHNIIEYTFILSFYVDGWMIRTGSHEMKSEIPMEYGYCIVPCIGKIFPDVRIFEQRCVHHHDKK